MESVQINWLGVLLAALSSFVIGGVWYSALFVKKWQKVTGLKESDLKKGMQKVFIGSFLLSVVMAINLAFFIGDEGAGFGMLAGFAVGFGWIAAALGINYLFERKSFTHFVINAGYNVVTATVMGLIIGSMQ